LVNVFWRGGSRPRISRNDTAKVPRISLGKRRREQEKERAIDVFTM
jgi:hypothetical protein